MLRPNRRISKKELKQDEFLEFLYRSEQFIRKYQKTLIYAAIGIVAVVVIAILMINSRQKAELAAAAEVGRAQSVFDQGNYQQVIDILEPVIETYDGTKSAGIATFYLGSASYRLHNYSDAGNYFQQYLDEYDNDPILSASASASLGAVAANDSNYTAAAQHYQDAARRSSYQFMKAQYSLEAAQFSFDSGDYQSAKNILTQLLDTEDLQQNFKTSAEELLSSVDVKMEKAQE